MTYSGEKEDEDGLVPDDLRTTHLQALEGVVGVGDVDGEAVAVGEEGAGCLGRLDAQGHRGRPLRTEGGEEVSVCQQENRITCEHLH